MMKLYSRSAAAIFFAAITTLSSSAQTSVNGHWVRAWSTAVHAPTTFPGAPSAPQFENQTIRMVIRPTIGGKLLRVRFSNEFGATPLVVGSVHVAVVKKNGAIVPGTDRVLKFSGVASVTIPPGSPMLTDPVELPIPALQELAVSIFLPKAMTLTTLHSLGQHDSYLSGRGDFTAAAEIPNPAVTKSWYCLSGLEVWASAQTASLVTIGDSITDGFGTTDTYADWPNQLTLRLAKMKGLPDLAVNNQGIDGNRILHDGAGVSALARLDRDVISLPGVTSLIILEGINDIVWPQIKLKSTSDPTQSIENPFAGQVVTANDLIAGLQQVIQRAREHGIRVFGATITPYEGTDSFTPDGEAIRQAVNQWIRTGGGFDGVIDFDAAVRDPKHPTRLKEDLQSGDHLHPNSSGYRAMADAIDLPALVAKSALVAKPRSGQTLAVP